MNSPVVYVLCNLSSITDLELETAIASLPEWRRELALKFKFVQGRKECAFSYLLLCRALREQFGIDEQPVFEYGEHGKPSIVGHPEVHFNLSHCKSALACAVSDQPIGVDIEMFGRYSESLARYCMSDSEVERIMSAYNPDHEFTKLWTQKEAALKLTGDGIADNIKDVLRDDTICIESFCKYMPIPVENLCDCVLSVAQYTKKFPKILFVNK